MVGSGDLLGLVFLALLLHLGVTSPLLTLRNNWAGIPCGNALQNIAGKHVTPALKLQQAKTNKYRLVTYPHKPKIPLAFQ